MYQVPCPMTDTSWPVVPNFLCFMCSLTVQATHHSARNLRRRSACRDELPAIVIRSSCLRDQALEFRNAGTAIGACLEPKTQFGGRARTRGNRIADCIAADTEAGADHRPRSREPLRRLARQQHSPLIVGQGARGEQLLDDAPVAGVARRSEKQAGLDCIPGKRSRAINAAAKIAVFGK